MNSENKPIVVVASVQCCFGRELARVCGHDGAIFEVVKSERFRFQTSTAHETNQRNTNGLKRFRFRAFRFQIPYNIRVSRAAHSGIWRVKFKFALYNQFRHAHPWTISAVSCHRFLCPFFAHFHAAFFARGGRGGYHAFRSVTPGPKHSFSRH